MTVCVAALCDGAKRVVVAADRQITVGGGMNVQFEHHERKIDPLTASVVVLSSGQALVATEVISRTAAALGAGTVDCASAAERLRDEYMAVHIERADQVIYRPRGWTLAEAKATGATQIPVQLYLQLDQLMFNFSLNTEFMLAGVDALGAHVFWIHYHGMNGAGWLENFDKIGYQSIGSGGPHAAISLHLAGQHKDLSLERTAFNVFRAKKTAEIAPGVGTQTDLAVVDDSGVHYLDEGQMKTLSDLNEKYASKSIKDEELAPLRKALEPKP